jgi:hypothetical protein
VAAAEHVRRQLGGKVAGGQVAEVVAVVRTVDRAQALTRRT